MRSWSLGRYNSRPWPCLKCAGLAFAAVVATNLLYLRCSSPRQSLSGSSVINRSIPLSLFDHNPGRYQSPLFNLTVEQTPRPLQVLQRYIQQHNVQAVVRDPNQRYYAIAFYQCPLQAGNRLHHFWNGLLWSILTNRTILWKYWDRETCLKYHTEHYYSIDICENANLASDCAHILRRAPWMMSYDDWAADQHDLHSWEDPFVVPYHATIVGRHDDVRRIPFPDNYQDDFGVDVLSKYPQRVLVWAMCHFEFTPLHNNRTIRDTLLHTIEARSMADELYNLGPDFLYGLLHRYTFDLAERKQAASLSEQVTVGYDHAYTIALHSRHRYSTLDGCNIDREVSCLQKTLQQIQADAKDTRRQVRVGLMSDRPCTVDRLTQWLLLHNISSFAATHNETTPDYMTEHGPYAGVGFYVDMGFVLATAPDAFIGMRRTSSDLIRERIAFDRTMEAAERVEPLRKLRTCIMANEPNPDGGDETN